MRRSGRRKNEGAGTDSSRVCARSTHRRASQRVREGKKDGTRKDADNATDSRGKRQPSYRRRPRCCNDYYNQSLTLSIDTGGGTEE
jgi:hypothetical protein